MPKQDEILAVAHEILQAISAVDCEECLYELEKIVQRWHDATFEQLQMHEEGY